MTLAWELVSNFRCTNVLEPSVISAGYGHDRLLEHA